MLSCKDSLFRKMNAVFKAVSTALYIKDKKYYFQMTHISIFLWFFAAAFRKQLYNF